MTYAEARKAALAAFEAEIVARFLRLNNGNVSAAARAAGLDRVYYHRLMVRHGITRELPTGAPNASGA